MTFANCPKCGSSNVTTAGVCANCGWTRFPQVMGAGESEEAVYELVGEIEIKVTGKALLDDYKRLLFENNSLTVRIAELETKIRHNALWQASEDAEERAHLEKLVLDLKKRIAELERDCDMLFRSAANKQSRKNTQTLTFEYGMESER